MTSPAGRIYPPGGVQLTLRLSQQGQEAAVVLGAKVPDGGALVENDMEAWRDAAWAAFRPLIAGSTSCVGATARSVSGPDGGVFEIGAPSDPTGIGGAAGPVAAACTLIKWSTGTGGRSGKGRSYLPGLPGAAVAGDSRSYDSSHVAKVNTAIAAYVGASIFSGTFRPAVLSFTKGQALAITGGSCAAVVGIQRRRMRA